jgi:signal transduction histidine kinase
VDILETNEKSIGSQTSESHDLDPGGNFAAMMDRIHKLRKESIAGINMLGRMTRAMDDHRAELKRRQLEQHNMQEQVQQFITVALAVDVLLAIFIPLLFLKSLSSRVNLLIQNAEKLPTAAPLNRDVKGSDEIAFLNKVLCDAKDTLAATEEEKQLLVDMISHDIRSPLSSAELLIGEMSRKPDEADPERLKRLQAIFRRIGRLVTDMLELEKLESGSIALDLQAFDIAETIRSSVDAIQPQAASKQVTIQSNLKKREIIADPSRLSQVLDNLLSNAVKHSPKGGTVQVSMRTDEDGIYILVSDQGDGIQGISGGKIGRAHV